MVGECKTGRRVGETCLLPSIGGYPVTKNGRLNCNRVRNAAARGVQFGVIKQLKAGGLCKFVNKCKIKSKFC